MVISLVSCTGQFAFHLFAVHNNEGGFLTPKLLANFLGSFATVLCACTEEGMEMAPEMLRSVIEAASTTAVTSLLGEFRWMHFVVNAWPCFAAMIPVVRHRMIALTLMVLSRWCS